jgi:hypothetical protein
MACSLRFLVVIKPAGKGTHSCENINRSLLKAGTNSEGE